MVILFDQFHLPEDIFEVIFATEQQFLVAKMLIEEMKAKGGEIGKTEMSIFATKLHDGTVVEFEEEQAGPTGPIKRKKKVNMSYNKRQFYDRILTPMKAMGLIDYDLYKKRYSISDKFNKAMTKIGLMWLREMQKPPREIDIH